MDSKYQDASVENQAENNVRSTDDRIADVYLGISGGMEQQRRARERIDWMFGQRRGDRALDVGCSQGILTVLLAREGMEVVGVDINPNAILAAQNLVGAEPSDVAERVSFKISDARNPSFVTDQFDTVFIGEVVEHLESPEALVHSAAKRLHNGGAFILTTPHGFLPHDDHYQAFGLQELVNLLPPQYFSRFIGDVQWLHLLAWRENRRDGSPTRG